uniref:BRCT domain-containing protein n=2 Tax=Erythrolobus australicus TaxID=1077150 RepID=A0A7S1XIP5_9RHOD|mmetsp:Transcript_2899/g.7966  ORF Transcript_2899/g.7966 Transcript_2899/m.7966 type:complete len:625 (+) Transcript_2899:33-1907(+)|eukprot:CAMPEP_0185841048 /NCGR_PEP_ID=MMETSP1353-20130828/17251_1 /TAXON_ID=1077150 /ORGANISM="Erythrolobus australicus, Strain CCMP3124" /LENGTH=624 /DNA_ID=CAMNT_0028540453 /DNA_START=42 /DNA_END=1916 /DNA_ORIENTATION=+
MESGAESEEIIASPLFTAQQVARPSGLARKSAAATKELHAKSAVKMDEDEVSAHVLDGGGKEEESWVARDAKAGGQKGNTVVYERRKVVRKNAKSSAAAATKKAASGGKDAVKKRKSPIARTVSKVQQNTSEESDDAKENEPAANKQKVGDGGGDTLTDAANDSSEKKGGAQKRNTSARAKTSTEKVQAERIKEPETNPRDDRESVAEKNDEPVAAKKSAVRKPATRAPRRATSKASKTKSSLVSGQDSVDEQSSQEDPSDDDVLPSPARGTQIAIAPNGASAGNDQSAHDEARAMSSSFSDDESENAADGRDKKKKSKTNKRMSSDAEGTALPGSAKKDKDQTLSPKKPRVQRDKQAAQSPERDLDDLNSGGESRPDESKTKHNKSQQRKGFISVSSHLDDGVCDAALMACEVLGQFCLLDDFLSESKKQKACVSTADGGSTRIPTVHVMDPGSSVRSIKLLLAIACGAKLVGPEWVFASVSAEKWLSLDKFLIDEKRCAWSAVARKRQDALQEHENAKGKKGPGPFLNGKRIGWYGILGEGVNAAQMSRLIQHCGGVLVDETCDIVLHGKQREDELILTGNELFRSKPTSSKSAEHVRSDWLWDSIVAWECLSYPQYRNETD